MHVGVLMHEGFLACSLCFPMSSASGSSAPRKQKRIHRACDSCRRRKHRCDGQEGQRCGNCTAAGRACTFSEKTQRASRKEVNRLKEELQSLKGDKKKSRSAAQPAEAEDRAFLQDSCFLGASSPFHLLCTLQKESTREVRSQTLVTSAAHPLLTGEKLPGEQRQRLEEVVAQVWPDAATETALLDAFFAQPHWIYPMFSEGAFKIQLSDEGSKGDFDFVRLAFALFAVASRYTEVIAESEAQLIGARFYDAWQRLETGGAIVSLSQIQSSLLATIYLMGTQLAASLAWLQLGKTVRMLQSVGAHRRGLADPWTRAWWIAYTLDREQACIFGRPLAIRDEDCDVGLPEDEEERWDRQTPLRGFISTLRLDAIIGSILLSGAPSGRASHDEHLVLDRLEQWRATNPLPYDLQQAKTPLFIQSSMLFLKYHYCRMLLARKAFLRGEAFQPTLEASQGIAKIIDGLLQRQQQAVIWLMRGVQRLR
ncbi:hypothetical protein FA10DRAFT_182307 [Acaromyces ingoldii]|uniref:Zn(2)-C6 fungal-type domain-containing protein n=1 Tax=Acaromyces ingoldii TaxID=215250 RepID=A0A316YF64_9BASI|nr:hypothetical protein FA10DRAFT_182307 [Acaromyces ingoldii]PWN87278.1 hypothetical protein FA10DRAFT_182307 [Acaromyces ingoldii]